MAYGESDFNQQAFIIDESDVPEEGEEGVEEVAEEGEEEIE